MATKKTIKTQQTPVIVRTYSAGVHFGFLASRDGKEVTLTRARRIWHWRGANTLNEIANGGVARGSKISEPVEQIVLTEAIEVLTCTDLAVKSLESVGWSS